jgi:hypothetical protein
MENNTHEGSVAKTIESQTAKLPSDVFLWSAIAAMGVSLTFKLMGRSRDDHRSLFFGQWVAPFLLFGIYNKIVKTQGHDSDDRSVDDTGLGGGQDPFGR